MVRKEMKFHNSEKLVGMDTYEDFLLLDFKILETMLEEDPLEGSFGDLLSCFLTMKSSTKKQKEKDDSYDNVRYEIGTDQYADDEVVANDLHYELFLKSLTEHGKSYAVKVDQEPFLVEYEGNGEGLENNKRVNLDKKRKLRSGSKKNNGPSYKPQLVSSQDLGRRGLRSGEAKSKEVENVKISIEQNEIGGPSDGSRSTSSEDSGLRELRSGDKSVEIDEDHCYRVFMRNVKFLGDCYICEYGDYKAVYEANDGESDHERDDAWGPYVEILDCDSLENMNNDIYSNLGTQFEFRHQLIIVLRKPYDEEEYNNLWGDITSRQPEKRHLDMRHGRSRSCSFGKDGKSYLDHYPAGTFFLHFYTSEICKSFLAADLEEHLLGLGDDDKPKRLILLRGFFYWLKNASHNGQFEPWRDAECLSIKDLESS